MFYRIDNNLILESGHNILFRCIFTNGGVVPTGTISITSNGTYDVASYANANVNVPQGVVPTGTKEITSNGVENIATYEYVDVNVPQGVFPTGTKSITQNGVEDVESYKYVDVNVPQPSGIVNINANGTVNVNDYEYANVNVPGIVPSGTIPITANGTVDVTNYANANVNVPQGVFPSGDLSITSNGTYDVTNYANAVVNVSGGSLPSDMECGEITINETLSSVSIPYDATRTPIGVTFFRRDHNTYLTPSSAVGQAHYLYESGDWSHLVKTVSGGAAQGMSTSYGDITIDDVNETITLTNRTGFNYRAGTYLYTIQYAT